MTEKELETSMNIAHTPGAWSIERAADWQNLWVGCPRYTVATISSVANRVNVGEMEANARLISAAPDLLEALQSFLRAPSAGSAGPGAITIAVQDFNLRAARAAIAKATGDAT